MEWAIDELMDEAKNKYFQKKGGDTRWEEEADSLKKQLLALRDRLSMRYINPCILARGGSGILIRVEDSQLNNQKRVIKFPRPLNENAKDFVLLLSKEMKMLAEMRHRSIVIIREAYTIELIENIAGINSLPFYIMDLVEGDDANIFLQNNLIGIKSLINIIKEMLQAIMFLHSNNIAHLDIKSGNILITKENYPVLVDLGTTKRISDEDIETKIATTWRNAPEELRRYILQDENDQSRAEGKISRKSIKLEWDLECISKMLFEWIEIFCKKQEIVEVYYKKYLLLMALRLKQDPYTQVDCDNYGLDRKFLEEIRYKNIYEVLQDIKKITPGNDLSSEIPEFNLSHFSTIQVASNDATIFTERLAKTLDHPVLRRLADISHLGIVQLVYPTSTHNRLEHSIGTYHNVIKYIIALYNDSLNPLFRQLMDYKTIRTVMLAALLHDVGQFPLAHDLEDIDYQMFNHISLVRAIIRGQRDEHIKDIQKIDFPSLENIFLDWQVDKDEVINILEAKINNNSTNVKHRILKSLISGPIDADKLDYLIRDSRMLHVPYPEGIDVDRLLRCLTIVVKSQGNGVLAFVGVHEKGRVPAEFMTFAKYAMFNQVYWHHSVRAIKGMLARALNALIDYLTIKDGKNKFRNDFEKYVLFGINENNSSEQFELMFNIENNDVMKKESFFEKYIGAPISAWDLATLKYFYRYMEKSKLPEKELLEDIIERKLYKRICVFSYESDKDIWKSVVNEWKKYDSIQKNTIIKKFEKEILVAIGKKLDVEETKYLTKSEKELIEARIDAGLPLIIIDVPTDKPGSKVTLEYVLEEDRRQLRNSNRICGHSEKDEIWEEYAAKLHEKAGRIRVFCHPKYIEAVLSAINKDWIGQILNDLTSLSG